MPEKLSKLERRLGYKFKDAQLLERSLTHRSWAHENKADGQEVRRDAQNESLEFVGDSVLGLVIAEELYVKNPTLNEGHLTLMKHRLVSTQTLARLSAELDIGSFLRMGKGEEKTEHTLHAPRSTLHDVVRNNHRATTTDPVAFCLPAVIL